MKIFNSLFIIILAVFFFGCESENVELNQILGDWQLKSTSVDIDIQAENPVKFDLDLSEFQYILSFKNDGTYTVKIDKGAIDKLKQLNVEIANYSLTSSGTYAINDGVFSINSKDTNNKTQKTKFKIAFTSNESFQIEMDKAMYLELIKVELESQKSLLASFGVTVDQVMDQMATDIKKFQYKSVFIKMK